MSVTAIAPASTLDAPDPVAPPNGLLAVPGVLQPEERGRWLNGVNMFGFPSDMPSTWDPCAAGTFRTKSDESTLSSERFDSFGVYLPIACSRLGMPDGFEGRAEAALDAVLSWAVEKAISQGSEVSSNPTLGDTNLAILAGGAAVTPDVGLSYLEDAIGAKGVRGIIHATPAVVAAWGFDKLRQGDALVTANGNYVAAGGGYIGADPANGSTAAAGQAWAFATAGVEVRTTEMMLISPEEGEVLDRSTNDVVYRAERYVLATWDEAVVQAGVLIDWTPA